MTHEIEVDTRTQASIQPHARIVLERARKLEASSLVDLTARVAEGLARLRLAYGLETRDADPVRALLAALPRTELARRAADLTVDLDAARRSVLERERAAAEVDRRSESLKEALRERSADLATALARADEVVSARRELESARAHLETVRAELEALRGEQAARRGEVETSRSEREAAQAELEALRGELDSARRDLADAEGERGRIAADLARALDDQRSESSALEASRRREAELDVALESERTSSAQALVRLDLARASLAAAGERELSLARLAGLEREIATDRVTTAAGEIDALRRERDLTAEELRLLQAESEARGTVHRGVIATSERALADRSREAESARRELEWRRREMDALRAESSGLRWKLFGGEAAERIARWDREVSS